MRPATMPNAHGGNERNHLTTFPHKQRRREEAKARQEIYDKLTTEEKFERAFKVNPSSRETMKLSQRMADEKEAREKVVEATKAPETKEKKKRIGKRRQEDT